MEAQVWLCILNMENFETLKKKKIYGVPDRKSALNQLKKVRPGDSLIFYVISPVKCILGISTAVSTVFEDRKMAPWRDRLYPYRIKVSEVKDIRVSIRRVLGKISGIKGRIPMGASLLMLGKNDFEIIKSLSGSKESSSGNW